MKRMMLAIAVGALLASPAMAKKKKKPAPAADAQKKKDADRIPPPGDKGTNEGAQGRMNATEGAAQSADSPQFDHRP